MTPTAVASLEAAIAKRAADFDLPALLTLLEAKFPDRHLQFQSRRSHALEPSLVHAIDFRADSVLITLNLGLLSSTTPLPAYVITLLDHPRAGPVLESLLLTVDNSMLAARAFAMSPLCDGGRSNAACLRAATFNLARPGSLVGLAWLFERVFPELSVSIRRDRFLRPFVSPSVVLGTATLGQAALGGKADVSSALVEAHLTTHEANTWTGELWASEARRRLSQHVFPALSMAAINLRVLLIDHSGNNVLVICEQGELGCSSLHRSASAVQARLYEGAVR